MTQVAHAQLPPPKIQPQAAIIKAPPGNVVFLVGHVSTGVQTYTCKAGSWGTSVPTAELVDDSRKVIVTHGAGPTWTATDGSSVKGAVQQRVTIDQTAIPWLLLSAAPVVGAPTGLLTDTTFIQRVNTTGGLAPAAADCIAATEGKKVDVTYGADYYFYRAAGKPSNPGKPGA
jgi:hypothetical protein